MTRKLVLTPDNDANDGLGPFYTVSYLKESEEARAERQRRSVNVAKFMKEVNTNELTKYLYEKEQSQRHAARRMAKQRPWDSWSSEQLMRYIKANWNNSAEPTIIGSRAAFDEGYSSRMTFRQQIQSARKIKQDKRNESARLNAVERAAEEGSFERRSFEQAFIDQVKQARAAQELTQQELANRINRPVNDLARLERGELEYDGELKSLLHNALSL
jgi:DNA-binding transcriptional regulator YiaG